MCFPCIKRGEGVSRGMPQHLTDDQRRAIVKARLAGDTVSVIARRFNCGQRTVYRVLDSELANEMEAAQSDDAATPSELRQMAREQVEGMAYEGGRELRLKSVAQRKGKPAAGADKELPGNNEWRQRPERRPEPATPPPGKPARVAPPLKSSGQKPDGEARDTTPPPETPGNRNVERPVKADDGLGVSGAMAGAEESRGRFAFPARPDDGAVEARARPAGKQPGARDVIIGIGVPVGLVVGGVGVMAYMLWTRLGPILGG